MMLREQQWFNTLTRWQTLKQRMGTVAKIATCAVVMSLAACGSNDDPNGGGSANGGDDKGAGIKAMLKENFLDDPKHNINSIQVGELVRYDLEVTELVIQRISITNSILKVTQMAVMHVWERITRHGCLPKLITRYTKTRRHPLQNETK